MHSQSGKFHVDWQNQISPHLFQEPCRSPQEVPGLLRLTAELENPLRTSQLHIIADSHLQQRDGANPPEPVVLTDKICLRSVLSRTLLPHSVVCAPVAVIAGHQAASDEQDQVHKPPDAETSQGEQFPDSGARVAQAETIDPKTTEEEGVEQRGDEIVSGVSAHNDTIIRHTLWTHGLSVRLWTLPSSGELVVCHFLSEQRWSLPPICSARWCVDKNKFKVTMRF